MRWVQERVGCRRSTRPELNSFDCVLVGFSAPEFVSHRRLLLAIRALHQIETFEWEQSRIDDTPE